MQRFATTNGIAVECDSCGRSATGTKSDSGLHCGKCGRFAQEADEYCAIHDVDYKGLYPQDNHCPACREERRIRDERQHMMTRDVTVEPW